VACRGVRRANTGAEGINRRQFFAPEGDLDVPSGFAKNGDALYKHVEKGVLLMNAPKLTERMMFLIAGCLMMVALPWAHASLAVGKPAPALEAMTIDGKKFSLAEVTGNVVIVNFWASWCEPCRKEMPAMETYFQKHKDEGLRILAISLDEPDDDAKVYQIMKNFTYPAAFQRNAAFEGYGRIWRLPMTFIIDRKGVLRKDGGVGPPSIDLDLLEKVVTPLLTSDGG
jgi:thiol-disulfide isomerase/thioredoxin